jgi:hypothetical protein
MTVDDSDEEHFAISEDEQSLSSATPSVLDMSSDQTLAHPTQMSKSHLTSEQRPAKEALAAAESDAVVDSTQDTDPKKSKSIVNMMNLPTGMKKEVDLTLHPLPNINQGVGDG